MVAKRCSKYVIVGCLLLGNQINIMMFNINMTEAITINCVQVRSKVILYKKIEASNRVIEK